MKKLLFLYLAFAPLFLLAQKDIKVMSFNIRLDNAGDGENQWNLRKEKVAGLMNFYEADFIGGQEVLHQQLTFLLENLKNYDFVGAGRDDGKTKGEYSPVFYKKDKYKLIKGGTFWLSPTPDSISKGWDAALNRVCSYGLFQDKKSKQFIYVFNTHFDHIGQEARKQSAKLIYEKIRQYNTRNYPVVMMGDLNLKPDTEPVQYLMSMMKYARANSEQAPHGNADTWNAFQFDKKPEGCIDYIFVNDKLKVKKFATITDSFDKKYYSDHFPILSVLEEK
jgi:endonuclease/exonuclease/phosphatase family metal-dependent hydrolase